MPSFLMLTFIRFKRHSVILFSHSILFIINYAETLISGIINIDAQMASK